MAAIRSFDAVSWSVVLSASWSDHYYYYYYYYSSTWEPKHCQVFLEGLWKRDLKEKNEVQLSWNIAVWEDRLRTLPSTFLPFFFLIYPYLCVYIYIYLSTTSITLKQQGQIFFTQNSTSQIITSFRIASPNLRIADLWGYGNASKMDPIP